MQYICHTLPHGTEEAFNLLEVLWHTVKDTAIILPFMFAAFVVIGMLERGAGRKMVSVILAADKVGPLAGGLLGAVPSCGFSAAASNLFGAGLLTTGTLLAVCLSTSDEMLAVMVANRISAPIILKILLIKVCVAILCGFLADGAARLFYKILEKREKRENSGDSEAMDTEDIVDSALECGCSDEFCAAKGGLISSAVMRTLRIFAFIFIISLAINIGLCFVDREVIAEFMASHPVLGCALSGLLGLIPNCAVSVALTEFWIDGVITAPMLLAGLMTGAGSGLLILWRTNENKVENITFTALLLLCGILFGSISGLLFF